MSREAKVERHFDASEASNESAAEQLTWLTPVSPTRLASFVGPFSTAC
jgi:hypothetical protein